MRLSLHPPAPTLSCRVLAGPSLTLQLLESPAKTDSDARARRWGAGDFYGQTLTTEQDAIFDVVASLNYSLDPDPDVQVTGTLFQKAQRGATVFDNINVQVQPLALALARPAGPGLNPPSSANCPCKLKLRPCQRAV